MNLRTTKYVNGGYEVKVGATVPVPSNRDHLRFTLTAHCEETEPERWRGRVALAGQTLLETEPVGSYEEACRLVENQWRDRLVAVFTAR